MADKALRGTKRTCQSGTCGQRFYDLNRDPIVCPICRTVYTIARGPAEPPEPARRPVRKAEPVPVVAGEAPESEADDALVDVDGADDTAIADADDETFLEDEEDGEGDVAAIVPGSGEDEEEG